jgi:hypothetical protein
MYSIREWVLGAGLVIRRPLMRAFVRLLIGFLLTGCIPSACEEATPEPAAEKATAPLQTVTLRFRPLEKLNHREHWVYDLAVPGSGVSRNALTLDTELLAKVDQDSFALRQTIRKQLMVQDGKLVTTPGLEGATLSFVRAGNHALVGEVSGEGKTPLHGTLAKLAAQLARFGTLIEFPDDALAVSDAWSIEPQRLMIAPGLEATLRPSYTLQAIEKGGVDTEAVIATDIQVDVVPMTVVEGVTVEGGGTASGTMRVRVRDGVLVESRAMMHFSQEITVQGSDVLGYREFSATAHVFTTKAGVDADLASAAYSVEEPEEDKDCALQIGSAMQRFRARPSHQRAYFVSALRGLSLPVASGGAPIAEPGAGVVISLDGKRIEIEGERVEPKDVARALRDAVGDDKNAVYFYAGATMPIERLRSLLALLPQRTQARLAVRDAELITPEPKIARWHEERLRLSLAATTKEEREQRLNDLLLAHLMLCEPAVKAFHDAVGKPALWSQLEDKILRAYLKCGCTATHLEGLEATLQAIFGTPDMRAVALPRSLDDLAPTLTVGDLAKLLLGPKPKPKPATTTEAAAPAATTSPTDEPSNELEAHERLQAQ